MKPAAIHPHAWRPIRLTTRGSTIPGRGFLKSVGTGKTGDCIHQQRKVRLVSAASETNSRRSIPNLQIFAENYPSMQRRRYLDGEIAAPSRKGRSSFSKPYGSQNGRETATVAGRTSSRPKHSVLYYYAVRTFSSGR